MSGKVMFRNFLLNIYQCYLYIYFKAHKRVGEYCEALNAFYKSLKIAKDGPTQALDSYYSLNSLILKLWVAGTVALKEACLLLAGFIINHFYFFKEEFQ
jgi:hypothetical protein